MVSLTAWKGKRTEDDGNWKARGGPAGLQHPAAKSSDKSRGNLAGSRGKCGLTTQHGTGGQKVLCDSKKNPGTATLEILGCCPPVMELWSQRPSFRPQEGWEDSSTSRAPGADSHGDSKPQF